MTEQIALIATFTASEGNESRVRELILTLRSHVRGIEGNTSFEVHAMADSPRRFIVYESYESKDSFEHHLRGEPNSLFNAMVNGLIEEREPQLTWLQAP